MLEQAPILFLLSGVDSYGIVLAGSHHFTTFINNFSRSSIFLYLFRFVEIRISLVSAVE